MKRLQSPQSVQSFDECITLAASAMAALDLHHSTSFLTPTPVTSTSSSTFSTNHIENNNSTVITSPPKSPPSRQVSVLYSGEVSWVDGVVCTLYSISSSTLYSETNFSDTSHIFESLQSSLPVFVADAAGWATSRLEWRNVLHGTAGAVVAVLRDVYADIVACGALVSVSSPSPSPSPSSSKPTPLPVSQPWLTSVVVSPAYRGIGLGSYVVRVLLRAHRPLIASAVSQFAPMRVPPSILASTSLVATPGSDSLYQRLGFKPSSTYSTSIMSYSTPSSSFPSSPTYGLPEGVPSPSDPIIHPRFHTPLSVAFTSSRRSPADPAHVGAAQYCASVLEPRSYDPSVDTTGACPTPRLARFFSRPDGGDGGDNEGHDNWVCAVVFDTATGTVVGAAWATFYKPLKQTAARAAFIGPVVADDSRVATAVVARLVRHVVQLGGRAEETNRTAMDIGMVALNVLPTRPAAMVWSSSAARFRAAANLSYMVRTHEVEESESDGASSDFDLEYEDEVEEEESGREVEVEHKLAQGELDSCDSSRYFCLAGYNG